jgi:hypothetical protein
MKTMRLLFLLPLAYFYACDAPPDPPMVPGTSEPMTMVHTFVDVKGEAEDGQPFDRMEFRLPTRMLPEATPKVEIPQGRWETIRHNKDWPRSTIEREALGMQVKGVCSDNERCDRYANCDGWDADGVNADGVDLGEYPVWELQSSGGGLWTNCEWSNVMPNRCKGSYSGGVDYISASCPGCTTTNFLQHNFIQGKEELYVFTGNWHDGYCARFSRESYCSSGIGPQCAPQGAYGDQYNLTFSALMAIHPGLNDSISSLLFTGHMHFPYASQGSGSLESFVGHLGASDFACFETPATPGTPCATPPMPVSSTNWAVTAPALDNKVSSIRINFSQAN